MVQRQKLNLANQHLSVISVSIITSDYWEIRVKGEFKLNRYLCFIQ